MRVIFTVLLLLSAIYNCYGQNTIGIPDIINYPKDVYNAGTQNRDIVQDRNGVIYFANYEGLLSFDGAYWKNYPLPNRNVVRALAIGSDNRIYAGGEEDFGYFSPDNNGRLCFTSLKALLPEKDNVFSDCWNIVPHGNDVFFRSREKIVQYNNKKLTTYPSTNWQFLGESNNQLIAQGADGALQQFSNGLWAPFVKKNALPANALVTCIFPFGQDSSFIATINTGFFVLHNNIITPFHFKGANPFENERVLTAIAVTKDWLAIATNLDGVFIVNKAGEVIQNLSRREGLQNNNILKLFLDNHKSLWLGLDNGIDFVAYNNAIKHIYPEKLNEGLGYTSMVFNNNLYVGTSNGLYLVPLTNKQDLSLEGGVFKSIPGTKGSTFGLSEVNGSLLLGHHDGAYIVEKDRIMPIDTKTTYWYFKPCYSVLPSALVLAGNNLGLCVLKYKNGHFTAKGNLPGFSSSSHFMAVENSSTVWIAHPYYGVYKIDIADIGVNGQKVG